MLYILTRAGPNILFVSFEFIDVGPVQYYRLYQSRDIEQITHTFVSRVGLVSNCVDQGDVELIRFDKEFLFLLSQASFCC